MSSTPTRPLHAPGAIDTVMRLHAVVDELVAPLHDAHGERLRCKRGCSACCQDDLTVVELEARILIKQYPKLFAEGQPGPERACALLDAEGACRVYAHRPYVCRTQGLPLRWGAEQLADDGTVETVEHRDICPLNDPGGPPIETLPAEPCWTLGPVETRLLDLQEAEDGGDGSRVRLRSLFA